MHVGNGHRRYTGILDLGAQYPSELPLDLLCDTGWAMNGHGFAGLLLRLAILANPERPGLGRSRVGRYGLPEGVPMDLAVLGLGRLGRTLVPLLASAGHSVQTWTRGKAMPTADVYWLTVSDDAVSEVAALVPHGSIVLHASGALEVDVLRPHRPAGSLHLLQTFPGPEIAIPPLQGVPAAVAGDELAIEAAIELAHTLGLVPVRVPGERRLYHAAAVLAGNFVTTLLSEAGSVLEAAGVEPLQARQMLAPLALASLRQAVSDPGASLTGPFARGDSGTIEAHLEALSREAPDLAALYRLLGQRTVLLLTNSEQISPEEARRLIRILE